MLKTKGAMLGVAVALVATALTFASMAVSTTTGAATDTIDGNVGSIPTPATTDTTTTPPQADIEQPVGGTDPTGDPAASGGAPAGAAGLPDAGFGVTGSDNSAETMIVLLGMAGAALLAAGGAATAARKR